MSDDLENNDSKPGVLRTLKAEYIESEHKLYVDELSRALQKPDVRNIALSGPYGVGKSSILQGFKEKYPDAIFISLSTLGFRESEKHHTPAAFSENGAVSDETNKIQKEIVKQLLYRAAPNKLPASRFRRIHRWTGWSRAGAACIMGLVITLVMVTLGIMAKIPTVLQAGGPWPDFLVKLTGLWLVVTVVALTASPFLEGRVHLDKITAGPTTVSLSRDNDSYFDEYLDEILYFFEVSRMNATDKTVVVFEDIDRFDNAEIFEELRELNTLLNNAEQLTKSSKRSGRTQKAGRSGGDFDSSPIVFIYAMKDSIFDASNSMNSEETDGRPSFPPDKASLEVERANRTKFFDLIIPVVPFVTHQSARDLLRQELSDIYPEVSDNLINRVAKYVPELRVIRSVCNEYCMYAKRLLGEGSLDLKPDHLFAMMLYKAVHLRDYEDIRLGRSNLDAVYRTSLKVIEDRIAELNQEYDDAEQKLTASAEAEKRGAKFEELITWAANRQFQQHEKLSTFEVRIKRDAFDQNMTKECKFWSALLEMSPAESMTVLATAISGKQISFGLVKEDLIPFTGERAIAESLESVSKDELDAEKKRIVAIRQHYRRARMGDLMTDVDAEVPDVHGKDSEDADSQNNGKKRLFSSWAEDVVGSPLAAMLIRHGDIDENFILYTSVYHETSLSVNAMTFKIRHMDRGEKNVAYELSDDEVKSILADVGSEELSRPGAYNIYILDYLLKTNSDEAQERLDLVVEGLMRNGDDERGLLQDYFSMDARGESFGKDQKMSLVKVLAPRYAAMFTVLIGLQGVDNDEQRDYVDIAFQRASGDIDYDVSGLKDFVESSYEEMSVFIDPIVSMNQKAIVKVLKRSNVKLADLSKVDENLRGLLIQNNCYEVNLSNLNGAAGSGGVSLDVLESERPDVYSYVLYALEEYLAAIGSPGTISAIAGGSSAGKVITDVAAPDLNAYDSGSRLQTDMTTGEPQLPSLKKVLDASNGEWIVDLDSVPQESWPVLAQYGRFTVSVANLLLYMKEHGMDESLASFLEKRSSIEVLDPLSEESYIKLAGQILGAKDLLTVEKRVELVASIKRDGFIPVADIVPEKGDLIGLLIKKRLIADDELSYGLAKNLHDWPTKEYAIASSGRYPGSIDFVDDDIIKVISSVKIGESVKQYVVYHLDLYCEGLDQSQVRFLIDYVFEHEKYKVRPEALRWLLDRGVDSARVIVLMARILNDMQDRDVRALVKALGNPYAQLLIRDGKLVRISNQKGHKELLERLKKEGSVSSFPMDEKASEYRVYRKRK